MSAPTPATGVGDADRDPALACAIETSGLDATSLSGSSVLTPEYLSQAQHTIGEYARTLATLHQLPVDPSIPVLTATEVAASRRRALAVGELDGLDVGAAYRHIPVARLVDVLGDGVALAESRAGTPVLTHGAPSLSVFRCNAGRALGLVSWERSAVGDRYRDLAVAARSIVAETAPALLPVFFDAYAAAHTDAARPGPGPSEPFRLDPVQLDWYSLVAELTP